MDDYREKYNEALERAKEIYMGSYKPEVALTIAETFIKVFPELKESEGEKIKEDLIQWVNEFPDTIWRGHYKKDVLAWLEKQGIKPKGKSALEAIEEKVDNANKVEVKPKFKVGDWVNGYYTNYKVTAINSEGYVVEDTDGNKLNILFENEKFHHLFTIADAKDGDMLYSPNLKLLWIYKSRDTVYCGCNLNYNDGAICGERYFERPTDAIPATKEQCDLFFQKIKEARCRWNQTEKKLEKIDSGKEQESKKEEWTYSTEECNYIIQDTISICEQARKNATNEIDYENTTRCIGWLKILKYRHTWKPSKEQIKALRWVLNNVPYNTHKEEISGLLEQIQNI